jgi:hypothetical protein
MRVRTAAAANLGVAYGAGLQRRVDVRVEGAAAAVPGAGRPVAALLPAETPAAALRGDAADPVPGEDALLPAGRVAEAGRGA